MLHKAPRGRTACARAAALPFRAGAFHALLCSNSFHHHPEPQATLREIRRVLAPDGRAVLVDPNLENPLARLTVYGGEALVFGMDVHLHSAAGWTALCAAAGFSRTQVTPIEQFPLGVVSLCIEARV